MDLQVVSNKMSLDVMGNLELSDLIYYVLLGISHTKLSPNLNYVVLSGTTMLVSQEQDNKI